MKTSKILKVGGVAIAAAMAIGAATLVFSSSKHDSPFNLPFGRY